MGTIPGSRAVRAHEPLRRKQLVEQIKEIQGEVSHRYGSPRMRAELQRRGRHVGKKRVARIMRENALGPRPKRRFVLTTRSEKGQEVAENLLDRNFEVPAANRVWVSDITYVATAAGWMYLCTVLDLYSRRVVGWSLSSSRGHRAGAGRGGHGRDSSSSAKGLDVSFRSRSSVHKRSVSKDCRRATVSFKA